MRHLSSVEILADSDLDFVVLDFEHGHHSLEELSVAVALLKTSEKLVVARMAGPGLVEFQRCHDSGVDFIQVAGVRNLLDCHNAAALNNQVGWSPWVRKSRLLSSSSPTLIYQIEFAQAFREFADPRNELPEGDFFLGRYDLSRSMNIELESAEDYRNLETFLHRCKSVRSNPWVVSTGQDDAKKLLEMGFEFISQGSDVSFVSQGLAKLVSERDKLERVGYGSRD